LRHCQLKLLDKKGRFGYDVGTKAMEGSDGMNFGEKLQALRKARGWSQEELAAQIEVSRQALSKWELGTSVPDTENVVKISRLFGVSTDYLLLDAGASGRQEAPAQGQPAAAGQNPWPRVASGALLLTSGWAGIIVLAVISALHPHVHSVIQGMDEGVREIRYTGLRGFLMGRELEWLFYLCCTAAVLGLAVLAWPLVRGAIDRLRKDK